MCKCTPEKRTPFCGAPGCEWPKQNPSEPFTVRQAIESLMRFLERDWDKPLVLRRHTLQGFQGPCPTINITGFYPGSDWNSQHIFANTGCEIQAADEEFAKERKAVRDVNETLGWAVYIVTGTLSDKDKVKELKKLLLKQRDNAA